MVKITEAEIIAALDEAQGYTIDEPENTYTMTELTRMWGRSRTAISRLLEKMIKAGTVERIKVRRRAASSGTFHIAPGYTFKLMRCRGNGNAAQGTSD